MGKTLQVRGTIQCVDLRTLNAEISEVIKQDLDEIDKRSIKELILAGGTTNEEIEFDEDGLNPAKFVYFTADKPTLIKINENVVGTTGIACTYMIFFGEITRLFLTTTVETKVRIIALA